MSFDVTAKVSAPLPTDPAVITSPLDQEHFSNPQITVSGTCPNDSYVKVFSGNTLVGVANCTTNTFSTDITLASGPNSLQAKVYNLTDDEGPSSPAITVYYDPPATPPVTPPSEPERLSLNTIEGTKYKEGTLRLVSGYPTFSGFAPADSLVTTEIHSEVVSCLTHASERGWWSCTVAEELTEGVHRVDINALTPRGTTLRLPPFYIRVVHSQPPVAGQHAPTTPAASDLRIALQSYHFQRQRPNAQWQWHIAVAGGKTPYHFTIKWGDGTTQELDRSDEAFFPINHTYGAVGTYRPLIRVTDAAGTTVTLQLLADVTTNLPPLPHIQSGISPWLLWSLYAGCAVVLLKFWWWELSAWRKRHQRRIRSHHA